MLVLKRCKGESIVIDGNIEIEIIDVRRMNGAREVKLGITAPRSITINRKGVQEVIDKQDLTASQKYNRL